MVRRGGGERHFLVPPQQLDLGVGEPELRVWDGRGEGGRHLEVVWGGLWEVRLHY